MFGAGPFRAFSRFLIYDYLNCDTIISESRRPVIYVCNYPSSWLDYFVTGIFPPGICVLGSSQIGKYFARFAFPANQVIVVDRPYVRDKTGKRIVGKNNGTFEKTLAAVNEKTKRGFSIMCYVDSSSDRKHERDIGKLYKGMFAFSKMLKVPILPVALDIIRRDKFGHVMNRKFWMKMGREHVVENEEESMKEVGLFFRNSLSSFIEREGKIKNGGD
jgi:1-acyl-sn-glycerol-3-phosphate acyltransferase